jgi:nucleoid-associated protein EbfC
MVRLKKGNLEIKGTYIQKPLEEASMKGIPNMGNIMKQAQQLQAKMAKIQEELSEKTVEASAGGGMITVVANGKQELISIHIEKEVIDPDDPEMLQDLVLAAVNDALTRAKDMMNQEMGKLTKGINIPGLPGLF